MIRYTFRNLSNKKKLKIIDSNDINPTPPETL